MHTSWKRISLVFWDNVRTLIGVCGMTADWPLYLKAYQPLGKSRSLWLPLPELTWRHAPSNTLWLTAAHGSSEGSATNVETKLRWRHSRQTRGSVSHALFKFDWELSGELRKSWSYQYIRFSNAHERQFNTSSMHQMIRHNPLEIEACGMSSDQWMLLVNVVVYGWCL